MGYSAKMARTLLVVAALGPVVVGNAARLMEPPVLIALGLLVVFAVCGAMGVRRLADAGSLAITPAHAAHVGQWRVAATLVATLPVWLAGLRVPAGAALIAADIAFWSVVLLGATRTRALSIAAAVVYAVARTSSFGALVTTNEELAATWALVHRVGAIVAAGLIVVVIARLQSGPVSPSVPDMRSVPDA